MKKIYITPAFVAVEIGMRSVAMLSASDDTGNIIVDGGDGDGTDIGVKEITNVSIWDTKW
ncbi:MAG: hypothetical protein IJ537_07520 [Bacteroidaceae bacterium]|nr:hypothetical protein [Bacteroidaceae bacterium]